MQGEDSCRGYRLTIIRNVFDDVIRVGRSRVDHLEAFRAFLIRIDLLEEVTVKNPI